MVEYIYERAGLSDYVDDQFILLQQRILLDVNTENGGTWN